MTPTKPHANSPITDSGWRENYIDYLTNTINRMDPLENPIKVKIPILSTTASTQQSHTTFQNISKQAKHVYIFSILHSSLISIGPLCDDECIVTCHKKTRIKYDSRLSVSNERIIFITIPLSIKNQQGIQHDIKQPQKTSKHKQTLVSIYQTNGTTEPHGISPNISTRLSHILTSYYLLSNKTHPDTGNQWWILLSISRSYRKNNSKVSTRVINYCQISPWPKTTTTSCISSYKCNTYNIQGRGKKELLFHILDPTKNYIMTLPGNFQFNQTEITTISWLPTTTIQTISSPHHWKIELECILVKKYNPHNVVLPLTCWLF